LGLFFTLVKGEWVGILGLNLADLDLLTILIAYLFLFYGQTATVVFVFGQGILIDLFSGGLNGLFTFLYPAPEGADDHRCPGRHVEKGDVFYNAHSLLSQAGFFNGFSLGIRVFGGGHRPDFAYPVLSIQLSEG
jgi:hypothetical protein